METQLDATLRETSRGKSDARKLRKAGRLPANIYGHDGNAQSVSVDPDVLNTIFRKSNDRNTVVQLKVGGKAIPCLVREVQRNPLTRKLVHVDFFRLEKGQEVVVEIPVEGVGKPKGAALGGTLRVMVRTVPLRVRWDKIPTKITADVTELDINDFINISQLTSPDGAFVYDNDFHVLTVVGKKAEEEEAPKAAEGEAAEGEAKEGEDKEEESE